MMSKLAKKLQLDVIDIHMGLFDFTVRVAVGKLESANIYIAKVFEVDADDFTDFVDQSNSGYEARGKCFFHPGYVPILWIPNYPQTPREHATLAHEAIHAVWHLFDWSNIPINCDTQEMMAHAVGHVVNTYLEKGNKRGSQTDGQ